MANKTKHLKDPSGNIEWINGKYPIPTAKGFRKDNQTPQPDNADEIVPEGVVAHDMSAEIHNRIAQLSNPAQTKKTK